VQEARATKPIVAVANPTMASAAYWIGSAATELLVSPSALVGSIGVFSAHQDISKFLEKEGIRVTLIAAGTKKTLANPFEPLSAEGQAEIQKRVDEFYALFVKAVAHGRGVSQAAVREGFGQGGMVGAAAAVRMRMADRVGVLTDAISLAAKRVGTSRSRAAATDTAAALFRIRLAELELEAPMLRGDLARRRIEETERDIAALERWQLRPPRRASGMAR
jgi:signal peptide peptidase SppA